MALDDYADLKLEIVRWSKMHDIDDRLDTFIKMTEKRIDNSLRARENEQVDTLTTSTSSRFLALPANFYEMRKVILVAGGVHMALRFSTPDAMRLREGSGIPTHYTVTSQIEFNKQPGGAYSIEITYFKEIEGLSLTNTTNSTLTNNPDLYLFGCLAEAYRFSRDEVSAQYYDSKFEAELSMANKKYLRGRVGPSARMIPRTTTP